MSTVPAPNTPPDSEEAAVRAAVDAVLHPLARLLVANGVTFATAEESLKLAMVQAARQAHPGGLPHRMVSRISTATGINRREVTRLTRSAGEHPRVGRSLAAELFSHWKTSSDYCDAAGRPLVLPRQGDKPSFESLARGVTQDVHPRSLMDELVRLGLAVYDATSDRVSRAQDAFVPLGDTVRMLGFLSSNVGDHLAAAVDNVVGGQIRHLERAVFAQALSPQSAEAAERAMLACWQALEAQLVPLLEGLLADDRAHPERPRGRRFRAGLFGYSSAETPAVSNPPPAALENPGEPDTE